MPPFDVEGRAPPLLVPGRGLRLPRRPRRLPGSRRGGPRRCPRPCVRPAPTSAPRTTGPPRREPSCGPGEGQRAHASWAATPPEVVFETDPGRPSTTPLSRTAGRELRARRRQIVVTRHTTTTATSLTSSSGLTTRPRARGAAWPRRSSPTPRSTLDDLETQALRPRTRVVAFPWASNAIRSTSPTRPRICHLALAEAGAIAVVQDAVHYAAHLQVDVRAVDADVLLCSPYRFFAGRTSAWPPSVASLAGSLWRPVQGPAVATSPPVAPRSLRDRDPALRAPWPGFSAG